MPATSFAACLLLSSNDRQPDALVTRLQSVVVRIAETQDVSAVGYVRLYGLDGRLGVELGLEPVPSHMLGGQGLIGPMRGAAEHGISRWGVMNHRWPHVGPLLVASSVVLVASSVDCLNSRSVGVCQLSTLESQDTMLKIC